MAFVLCIGFGVNSLSAVSTWDNSSADFLWGTATNWADNALPDLLDATTISDLSGNTSNYNISLAGTFAEVLSLTVANAGTDGEVRIRLGDLDLWGNLTMNDDDNFRILAVRMNIFGASSWTTTAAGGILMSAGSLGLSADLTLAPGSGFGNIEISSDISGSNKVTMSGAGTTVLSGNNSFGSFDLTGAGIISVGSSTALGSGLVTINNPGAKIQGGAAVTVGNAVTVSTDFTVGGGNALGFSGDVALGVLGVVDRTINLTNTANTTFSGALTGSATGGSGSTPGNGLILTADADTRTLVLSGTTNNTFTGDIDVGSNAFDVLLQLNKSVGAEAYQGSLLNITNNSKVQLLGNNQIKDTSDVNLTGTATFDLNGNNDTIAELNGVNGSFVTLGAGTLTFGDNTTPGSSLASKISGTGGIVKNGTSTYTLTGANDYSGSTTINGGAISVSVFNGIGNNNISSVLTLNNGTFINTGNGLSFEHSVTLGANGGTIQTDDTTTFSGAVTGTGGLTKTGASTLSLIGTNTYAGATTVGAGTLSIGLANSLPAASTVSVGTNGTLSIADINGTISNSGTTTVSGSGALTLNASGGRTTNFSGNVTMTGTSVLTATGGGIVQIGADTANSVQVSDTITVGAGTTLTINSTGTFTLGTTTTLANGSTLDANTVKLDADTLTVTNLGTATLTGDFDNAGGTVAIGTGGATTLNLTGAVTGTGSYTGAGGVANFSGSFSPGASASAAQISFANDVTFANGSTVTMELGGTTAGTQFDQLVIAGALTLGAGSNTLVISLINGFNPSETDTFQIFNATGGTTNTFNTLTFASISGTSDGTNGKVGDPLRFTFNTTTGTLSVIPEASSFYLPAAMLLLVPVMRRRMKKSVAKV